MSYLTLTEKTISELLKDNYFIPSYQRGYRWTEQQVKDLLDDIWDFANKPNKSNEWYCLQPLVVKKKSENEKSKKVWEVIDGQQRLTTIFLILKHLERNVESDTKTFEIEYKTRTGSKEFLKQIDKKNKKDSEENIDYFHIFNAFEYIQKWFKEKANDGDSSVSCKFITPFLEHTKVIWYAADANQDGRDIFTRINMGKIPLTNAELIKALFLNSSNFKTKDTNDAERIRLKQLEIASEWDFIEYSLHNDEFWWFINKDENEKETRIEFLFELMVGRTGKNEDGYFTFRKFNKRFNETNEKDTEKIITENWKEVKRYFQILQDWFDDRELYHKIGFLVTNGVSIKELIDESQEKNKSDFNPTFRF